MQIKTRTHAKFEVAQLHLTSHTKLTENSGNYTNMS